MKKKFIFWASPKIFGNEKVLINNSINSSWISGGSFIHKFEDKLSNYLDAKYCYLTCNGTAALHLAFLACGLKHGDEIIVPGFGYLAAANIGSLMGLNVKFADVDKNSYCLSVSSIKKIINKKTKAVVTINTYGNMYELDKLSKFLKQRKILLIEDAAESFGSKYLNKQSGTFGDIGTFSFHATKNITTGEGGLVITNKKKFSKKLALYRSHGVIKKRYFHLVHGHNFRLTNFQAAMGYVQLSKINYIIRKRKDIYKTYIKELNKLVVCQTISENCKFVPWTFAIEINKNFKFSRDKIISKLIKIGIETRNGFYSPNNLKIFKKTNNLYNSDKLSKNIICLPIHLNMSNIDVKRIAKEVIKFLK